MGTPLGLKYKPCNIPTWTLWDIECLNPKPFGVEPSQHPFVSCSSLAPSSSAHQVLMNMPYGLKAH